MARMNLFRRSEGKCHSLQSTLLCAITPLLIPLLVCSPAFAGDSLEEARVLYQKGNAAFSNGDDVMAR